MRSGWSAPNSSFRVASGLYNDFNAAEARVFTGEPCSITSAIAIVRDTVKTRLNKDNQEKSSEQKGQPNLNGVSVIEILS